MTSKPMDREQYQGAQASLATMTDCPIGSLAAALAWMEAARPYLVFARDALLANRVTPRAKLEPPDPELDALLATVMPGAT